MVLDSSSCPVRPTFVRLASQPQGLEQMLDDILLRVKQTLCPKAQFARSPATMQITLVSKGRVRRLSLAQERVIELEEVDLRENVPQARRHPAGSLRGMYVYPPIAKLMLVKRRWCLKTLIHETLHSISVFAERPDLRARYDEIKEGLTEFYAGYLMFNHYRDCYQAWRNETYDICSVTYAPSVQFWGALCRFVSIRELANIYFWLGHSDWEKSFEEFVDRIRKSGYPRFKNVLLIKKKIALRVYLIQECVRSFGHEFEEIVGSRDRSLNFSSMVNR